MLQLQLQLQQGGHASMPATLLQQVSNACLQGVTAPSAKAASRHALAAAWQRRTRQWQRSGAQRATTACPHRSALRLSTAQRGAASVGTRGVQLSPTAQRPGTLRGVQSALRQPRGGHVSPFLHLLLAVILSDVVAVGNAAGTILMHPPPSCEPIQLSLLACSMLPAQCTEHAADLQGGRRLRRAGRT